MANLIMTQIPDHLVGYYLRCQSGADAVAQDPTSATPTEIDPAERGPLSYVAGYIVFKLFQPCEKTKNECSEDMQALLQSMKTETTNTFISARSRGGLVTPSDDLLGIAENAELCFRQHVNKQGTLREIPLDDICVTTMESSKVLWAR